MSRNTNFETVRVSSELFGRDFRQKLTELELFEENIMTHPMSLRELDFRYDATHGLRKQEPFVLILPSGQEFVMSHKSVADVLSKSKIKTSISSYDDVSVYPEKNSDFDRIGTSILYHAISDTHRDRQKVIEYEGVARAVLNKLYPEKFRLNRLTSALVDNLELQGQEVNGRTTDLKFDSENGSVRLEVIAETENIDHPNISVNDEVGFGVTILNNYYGNRKFSLYLSTLNLACLNGMLGTSRASCLDIVHSSDKNMACKIGGWLKSNQPMNMSPREWNLVRYMETGYWVEEKYEPMFYDLFSRAIIDTVQREKEQSIIQMQAGASKSFEDFDKELEKLERANKISRYQSTGIEQVWENDDTIASGQQNDYYLSMAVSRYANDPAHSDKTKEELQGLAHEILVRVA